MGNDIREIRDRLLNGLPARFTPKVSDSGMQMRMSIQKGMLTIELARKVDFLQLTKADASNLIKALVQHYNQME